MKEFFIVVLASQVSYWAGVFVGKRTSSEKEKA